MRRSLAALLALLLAGGPLPVEAANLAASLRAGPSASPILVVPALSPAAALSAPAGLSAVSLTTSLSPAPSLIAAPAPFIAPTVSADASASQILTEVASAKEPASAATLRFDGAKPQGPQGSAPSSPASGSQTPSSPSGLAPATEPTHPAPKRGVIDYLRQLNKSTAPQSRDEKWLQNSLGLGIALAVAAPILYQALPVHTALTSLPVAMFLPTLVFASVALARIIRFVRGKAPTGKPQGPPRLLKAAALGLAIGLTLGGGPVAFKGPIIEAVASIVKPAMEMKRVHGSVLKDEIIKVLSENPVGRDVLDGLRDRGGKIRIPDLFISEQDGSMASTQFVTDVVAIAKDEITSRGWTVEQFLRDPALQRAFAKDFETTFAHELRHAAQSRRSILHPETGGNMQVEYEAFMTEHFYVFEQLKADPKAKLSSENFGGFISAIEDLEKYLKDLDGLGSYENNKQLSTPYYDAYFAKLRAGWPAHQVEGWTLMARRNLDRPKVAAMYLARANAVADKAGLPRVTLP